MRVSLWLLVAACAASSSEIPTSATETVDELKARSDAPESQAAWVAECLGEAPATGEFLVDVTSRNGFVATAQLRTAGLAPDFEACLVRNAPGMPLDGPDGRRDLTVVVY